MDSFAEAEDFCPMSSTGSPSAGCFLQSRTRSLRGCAWLRNEISFRAKCVCCREISSHPVRLALLGRVYHRYKSPSVLIFEMSTLLKGAALLQSSGQAHSSVVCVCVVPFSSAFAFGCSWFFFLIQYTAIEIERSSGYLVDQLKVTKSPAQFILRGTLGEAELDSFDANRHRCTGSESVGNPSARRLRWQTLIVQGERESKSFLM